MRTDAEKLRELERMLKILKGRPDAKQDTIHDAIRAVLTVMEFLRLKQSGHRVRWPRDPDRGRPGG